MPLLFSIYYFSCRYLISLLILVFLHLIFWIACDFIVFTGTAWNSLCLFEQVGDFWGFVSFSQGDMKREFLLSSVQAIQRFLIVITCVSVLPFSFPLFVAFLNTSGEDLGVVEFVCIFCRRIYVSGCKNQKTVQN